MNDIPEIFEEPLLRSSTLFGFEIPLVSLRIFAFSSIGLCEEVKKLGCPPAPYRKSRTGLPVLGHP